MQLTKAFRSLSRPSSALSAKASTLRSFLLYSMYSVTSSSKMSSLYCLLIVSNWFVNFSDVLILNRYLRINSLINMKFSRYNSYTLRCVYMIIKAFALFISNLGDHLLSHAVSSIVSSADFGLTIVFGMYNGCFPKSHHHQEYLSYPLVTE